METTGLKRIDPESEKSLVFEEEPLHYGGLKVIWFALFTFFTYSIAERWGYLTWLTCLLVIWGLTFRLDPFRWIYHYARRNAIGYYVRYQLKSDEVCRDGPYLNREDAPGIYSLVDTNLIIRLGGWFRKSALCSRGTRRKIKAAAWKDWSDSGRWRVQLTDDSGDRVTLPLPDALRVADRSLCCGGTWSQVFSSMKEKIGAEKKENKRLETELLVVRRGDASISSENDIPL
ncbi:MAG: hypothetical protein AAB652_00055 [Patescibacteria group bacterium]